MESKIDPLPNQKKNTSIIISKQSFIKNSKGNVTQYYEVIKKIGEGAFGKIYKVKHKASGDFRAMKQIIKEKVNKSETFKRELQILSIVDHPHIVRFFEFFEDEKYFYLIMELCSGGDLLDKMKEKTKNSKTFSEKEALIIIKQLLDAIAYCHHKKICHRDLKPENILFTSEYENKIIKVIDFGFSIVRESKNSMADKVGTLYYISPEIIKGNYNEKCDIWACGVILYVLLCGCYPFNGKNDQEIYQNIQSEKFEYPQKVLKVLSKNTKDLISGMICSENKRLSAKKILNNKKIFSHQNEIDIKNIKIELERLVDFATFNELKKTVLLFIASRLNINDCLEIKDLFLALDINHNGVLTKEDFVNCLINNEYCKQFVEKESAEEIFDGIDMDKDGEISYTEFLSAYLSEKIYLKDKLLKEAFHYFSQVDADIITKNEIFNCFNLEINNDTKEIAEKLIEKNDFDKDGKIDYKDFYRMMKESEE